MTRYATLLANRYFWPLFGAQFLGAFNDNLLKQAIIALVTFRLIEINASMINNLAAALFILPFFFFSPIAGQLADHFPKPRIAWLVKVAEIFIMLIAGVGFMMSNIAILLTALTLMGLHSAIFGPVKYGVLPELLPPQALTAANSLIAAGTFLAILLGNVGGVYLITKTATLWEPALWLGLVAVAGLACALAIPPLPAAAPHRRLEFHPWRELTASLKFVRNNRAGLAALIGISWFWFIGATYLTQLPVLARDVVHADADAYVSMLLAFSIGIGIGALLCGRLSRDAVTPRLTLAGAIVMILAAGELVRLCIIGAPPMTWLLSVLTVLGVGGGLYIVPLYTLLQVTGPSDSRARVFAALNLINALAMVLSAALAITLLVILQLPIAILFTVLLAGTIVITLILRRLLVS